MVRIKHWIGYAIGLFIAAAIDVIVAIVITSIPLAALYTLDFIGRPTVEAILIWVSILAVVQVLVRSYFQNQ